MKTTNDTTRRRDNISADSEAMRIIKRYAHAADRNLLNLIDEIMWDFADSLEAQDAPTRSLLSTEEAS